MTDDAKAEWRRLQERRPEPRRAGGFPAWHRWYVNGEYLGERSARTGPDVCVVAAKACDCDVCAKGRGT